MKGELPYQILEYRLELLRISKWFWHKHRNADKWNRIENQEWSSLYIKMYPNSREIDSLVMKWWYTLTILLKLRGPLHLPRERELISGHTPAHMVRLHLCFPHTSHSWAYRIQVPIDVSTPWRINLGKSTLGQEFWNPSTVQIVSTQEEDDPVVFPTACSIRRHMARLMSSK